MKKKEEIKSTKEFNKVVLKVASPEKILDWSYGEVTKPETINYRTQRSEKGGLFDEKIFGPEKDFECYCGKYKGIRYKGIVCEKCGVEITKSIVRRERMGHIELATPVSHIWFLKSIPSKVSTILGLNASDVERVIYFAGYIINKVNEGERERVLKEVENEYKTKVKTINDEKTKERLKELLSGVKKDISGIQLGVVLDELTYHKYALKYGTIFEAGIGAEAIYDICAKIDLKDLAKKLEKQLETAGAIERVKLSKRLALTKAMDQSDTRPEWMFLTRIPVIPPALRPMVALGGGRHATSDVNDLYRRVINRNNRLVKLKEINAPEVILRNEKRILQEAVDSLIDNSKRTGAGSAMSQAQRRPLKSLSDNLKGKQGLFRQNLLGKRVDYSGRSVIVVGPDLHLDECGLPKHMALELFKPFVISKILKDGLAYNIKWAGRLIDEGVPEVWAILEGVIKGKYVLLNRAPTLHRLGIQAFRPRLIEGNAIQVHPLVCSAFNADFDGDQMAVHVPLSEESQLEAKEIMASDKNVLKPGNGRPVVSAKLLDIVLGCYWMTKIVEGKKGEGKFFQSPNAAITAYDMGVVDFRSKIKVMATENTKYAKFEGSIFETSVGRLLFNSVLPSDYAFINEEMTKKSMSNLIDDLIDKYGVARIPAIMDKIKNFGFKYVTTAGITWGIDDIVVPEGKGPIIKDAQKKSANVWAQYDEGLLSEGERRRANIEIWHAAKGDIEKLIPDSLDPNGSVHDMWKSGARGSLGNLTQMVGMKGLIQNTLGETIEFPIISSSKEGLTPIEYFITTHGSRKGLADTALNTAKAGYLTRRLFDVAQDVVINTEDCGTKEAIVIKKAGSAGFDVALEKSIRGRFLAKDVKDANGNVLFKKDHLISRDDARAMESAGVEEVIVRSPMSCEAQRGICKKCYGIDLGSNELINLGEAVGTIAAQAIGEPGTQLTMRTFHSGGTASVGGDITQGLPRVEEIFERRSPKIPATISKMNGTVIEIIDERDKREIIILPDVEDKTAVKKDKKNNHEVPFKRIITVKVGDKVKKGDLLTDGSADISEMFKYAGKARTQDYIIDESTKIYELQGASISRKHIEVIIKQMFSRSKIKTKGDTNLNEGEVVEDYILLEENRKAKEKGLEEAKVTPLIFGITEVSLTRESFLSSVSFQNTTKMLINAALRGAEDNLSGLKENIIVGNLIPAGTGYEGSPKKAMIDELQASLKNADVYDEE
ncbi:DNA-directed RNA polymerase subunit beta' [Candidatus Campbellbacteria bacterium RIFCSPLOWO2_02_FULL_35_11]|uniref:DNA-directed RNA polymerase subunit beta' n=2 Tax=Candidatus Campbelliibacteriota TaxID=1752727 RepID=A0A1F5EL93_9BACT|nr:MAG: DNA-directed RNA polymerase subunit beta' [Candidatus Campbellbacteria bacterium RIFCSPHIGHO2_12_FULL_35_10]OGD70399.1 MAG: DNA-directed RNA polymerase subunit beta' [Candidatus Campbellbacteria bacterium RIFCSPLOWO2_02_FULL_35_11]